MKKITLLFFILSFSIMAPLLMAQPPLAWVKQIGGTNDDKVESMTIDGSGNIYTTGYFRGTTDFDPSTGTSNLTSIGNNDIFVQKLDPNGNLLWAKQMGGTGFETGLSILTDSTGNVYTTGRFQNTVDFDPGIGTMNLVSLGNNDAFIQKLDPNGNFIWAKQLSGTGFEGTEALHLDANGNVYTTGFFGGTVDFDPGAGINNLTAIGTSDIFLHKLDPNGNFLWVKQMGGTSNGSGQGIISDANGNIYTTGYFQGTTDFDPGAGTANLTTVGNWDVFIQKLDPSGNFLWVKQMGGSSNDQINSIALDSTGNIYTTGYFQNTVDFDPGAGTTNLVSTGLYDAFVQKLDPNGGFLWVKQIGSTSFDNGTSITTDGNGNVYTIGNFRLTADFDPGVGIFNLLAAGRDDIFIQKLDSNGDFLWATKMGGASIDAAVEIVVDANGNIYTAGSFQDVVDFDPGAGIVNLTSLGNNDIFIQKLGTSTVIAIPSIAPSASKLYPNPSTNQLTIELEQAQEATISILDNQGRLVHPILKNNQQQIVLELAHLPTGIYYIAVTTANKTTVEKWSKL
ncbi:MAG: SBBP repeat-containing protein [Aureispira sp.]